MHYDGLLNEQQRLETAVEHLKNCPACKAALANYAQMRDLLQAPSNESEPAGGWSGFQDRLQPTMTHGGIDGVSSHQANMPSLAGHGTRQHTTFIGWRSAMAVAASIVFLALSIVGTSYLSIRSHQPMQDIPGPASLVQFKPAEVSQQVEAFAKVSEAFDNRASWMLISDHTSDVGVAEANIPERTLLLLRLSLLHAGAIISHADLILIPGQQADLTLPSSDGQILHYRMSASNAVPTTLSLWLGIENTHEKSATIAALSTQLPLAPGQVVSAGQMATVSGTYELKVGFVRAKANSGATPSTPVPTN